MFNNVVLDVAIGIVFIFLIYSLLATSIQEAIATAFAMRARTLRKGIIKGMLTDTHYVSKMKSIWISIQCFFENIWYIFAGKPKDQPESLGQKFYDHPIIKNYGSSSIFPNPSYLPNSNFSTILLDVLKDDFDNKIKDIANSKIASQISTASLSEIVETLQSSSDAVKIKELIAFYGNFYAKNATASAPAGVSLLIDKDTWQILQLYLRNSLYSIDEFTKKLETWYDDSMNRVSGWYKRQVQLILFIIGIALAIVFNVDVLQIAGKLSTDKDARDQLVQLAIKQADNYKNDPRVTGTNANTKIDPDKADSIYNQRITEAKKTIDTSIVKANHILALGWGNFNKKRDSVKLLTAYFNDTANDDVKADNKKLFQIDSIATAKLKMLKSSATASVVKFSADTSKTARNNLKTNLSNLNIQYKQDSTKALTQANIDKGKARGDILDRIYPFWDKVGFIIVHSWSINKLLGFLITAFAISLGAPFWFDALNKLVNLRASGKKEDNTTSSTNNSTAAAPQQPVSVSVNTQPSSEEAVG